MGGGGGTNPASGMTGLFGSDVQHTGDFLTGQSWQLQAEDKQAFAQEDPLIGQMLNTAFDPQQQLYGRTLQQVTDQTRSGEAARGVANTPYGAAAEGNALGNFNIDWQNQQFQRQQSGLSNATADWSGLIGAGASAAQPAEAALSGYANAFSTSSQAATADLKRQQEQQNQLTLGDLGQSLGSSFGPAIGKGGGGAA